MDASRGAVIDQYLVDSPVSRQKVLDHDRVVKLPLHEFRALHLALMVEYRDKDGWWGDAGVPRCSDCRVEVPGPEDLVRYHGRTFHRACFLEFYSAEMGRVKNPLMRAYWDRVAEVCRES